MFFMTFYCLWSSEGENRKSLAGLYANKFTINKDAKAPLKYLRSNS